MPAQLRAGSTNELTRFFGRHHELDEVRRLLATSRLVTLTGAGGCGKTRLAQELMTSIRADFPDGIFWIPLAAITEPALVAAEIAQGAGIPGLGERTPMQAVAAAFDHRRALLVLDNFEHLVAAAHLVGELLRATEEVSVLTTSRAPLRISGEQEFEVLPLPVPLVDEPTARAAANAAVCLFVDRATSVDSAFKTDADSTADVARIVRRLDGLPLAIELAAARVKTLPPSAMVGLLEHSLPFLVGGPRDAPDRHRTLRATIEWSYELLGADAKRLLATCSVFRGGFELTALAAVSGSSVAETANLLEELVDQSLVQSARPPGARHDVLETIREFAAEQLALAPDAAAVAAAHASVMLALCEDAAPRLAGPDVKSWLDRLDLELDNLRAALDWFEEHDRIRGLRMAAALWEFWERRGYFSEGRDRLRTALKGAPLPTVERIRALSAGAELAIDQGDLEDAGQLLDESLRLGADLDHPPAEAEALVWSARVRIFAGKIEDAVPYLDRAGGMLSDLKDPVTAARLLHMQGLVEYHSGHLEAAREIFEANLRNCHRIGFRSLHASTQTLLGAVLVESGDLDAARASFQSALTASLDIGDHWMIHLLLTWLAALALAGGRPRTAMLLTGAAQKFGDLRESKLPSGWLPRIESGLQRARKSLGSAAGRLIAEGRRMTLDEACKAALSTAPDGAAVEPLHQLTRRQREVARLVAEGSSNREIAAKLVVSERTAEYHVQQILNTLGFGSRAQIAAWYAERR